MMLFLTIAVAALAVLLFTAGGTAACAQEELRLPIEGEEFAAYGQQVLEGLRDYAAGQEGWQLAPDNHEGLRYSFDREGLRGWFLLRLSLHDPLMPLNIEADTPGGAKAIARMLQGYLDGCSRLNCRVLDDFCRS